jgi:hypothetical protein
LCNLSPVYSSKRVQLAEHVQTEKATFVACFCTCSPGRIRTERGRENTWSPVEEGSERGTSERWKTVGFQEVRSPTRGPRVFVRCGGESCCKRRHLVCTAVPSIAMLAKRALTIAPAVAGTSAKRAAWFALVTASIALLAQSARTSCTRGGEF